MPRRLNASKKGCGKFCSNAEPLVECIVCVCYSDSNQMQLFTMGTALEIDRLLQFELNFTVLYFLHTANAFTPIQIHLFATHPSVVELCGVVLLSVPGARISSRNRN